MIHPGPSLLDSPTRMPPTPARNVRHLIYQVVAAWNTLVLDLRAPATGDSFGSLLSRAVWLWQNRQPVPAPYDKCAVIPLLNDLLSIDSHLSATCRDARSLARALDVILLERLADSSRAPGGEVTLDQITDFLVGALFEEDYARRVYFRLYNLEVAESPLRLPGVNGQLERLEAWQIPAITGEATPTSTLHLPDTGNVFLITTDSGSDEDRQWWQARWQDATALAVMLKYLKYAVIEVDYSAIHFSPDWLNQVRRYGVALWGRPRTDVQTLRYALAKDEERTLARFLAAGVKFQSLLDDLKPPLRRALATAGDYYEGHHRRTSSEDQLIDLTIALEALFSPTEATELRFRISHRTALLIGRNPEERRSLLRFLRKIYDARSALVHEGKSPFAAKEGRGQNAPDLTPDDVQRFADLVRQAILRLGVWYARERPTRDQALGHIEDCAYDPSALDGLRQKTDIDAFLDEQGL